MNITNGTKQNLSSGDDTGFLEQEIYYNGLLSGNTSVNEYLKWLERVVGPQNEIYSIISAFRNSASKKKHTDGNKPFLSVITRTQGKRPEALAETLLSLTAQSDTDFELLVLGHNLDERQNDLVIGIINDMPEWMRNQTRFVPVEGGTRTTPLNVGFSEARGEYIVALDDDDIVFDNWVEEFHKCAKDNPGVTLHAYVVIQDWMTIKTNLGVEALRAVDAPRSIYCQDFDLLRQLVINNCPLLGLAFPAYAFQELGIRFDETLTTTEDWDFLMRVVLLTGAHDIQIPTSLYRWWVNAESSQTIHNKKEWENNYKRIQKKLNDIPIIFPKGIVEEIAEMQNIETYLNTNSKIDLLEAKLYYDNGNGYSEARTVPAKKSEENGWIILFDDFADLGKIRRLRFDPLDKGGIELCNFEIKITRANGSAMKFSGRQAYTNGFHLHQKIVFLKSDPQLDFSIPYPSELESVRVYYEITPRVTDDTVETLLNRNLFYLVRKIFSRISKVYHKIFG